MSEKPRADFGDLQEPPPPDDLADIFDEEDLELITFEELLARADEMDEDLPL